ELAYLLRDGDMSHTMLVLITDMVQRAAKSRGDNTTMVLQPYETVVFSNVRDHMKRWAQQKAEQIIPLSAFRSPWQFVIRFKVLKRFFAETLHQFIADTIKDPLHIKKYFSFTGIVRFALDLYTSGARQGVEENLRNILSQKGMLVPAQSRFN